MRIIPWYAELYQTVVDTLKDLFASIVILALAGGLAMTYAAVELLPYLVVLALFAWGFFVCFMR